MLTSIVIRRDSNRKAPSELEEHENGLVLEVSNTYKDGKDVDYSKFFERFLSYRRIP